MDLDRLIQLVFERKPLWDQSKKEYHNRDVTRKLWNEVADELHEPYGFEQKSRIKRPRAPPPPLPAENDLDEDYPEERNNELSSNIVPPGFLSPSVQEYLELGKSIPGRPGTDYPVLGIIPYTNFYCDDQPYPGFFADPDTRCQSWHYCDIDGRQTTFLCPNGTQFNQAVFACDWWFNVRCELSTRLYIINARLYGRPKLDPSRPHRTITKQLLEDIFNDE